ncbi:hypothetical protein SDJN03_20509, partial [Cucurbita argyrosperma subsp. sororia]
MGLVYLGRWAVKVGKAVAYPPSCSAFPVSNGSTSFTSSYCFSLSGSTSFTSSYCFSSYQPASLDFSSLCCSMGSSLELGKSSSHRHNSKCPVRPRSDLYCVSTKGTNIARETSYRQANRVEQSPIGEDEVVRHMSNLPAYLLHTRRVENLQDKVLNVGVLDWTRLQNWKHHHIRCPTRAKDVASCSNTAIKGRKKLQRNYTSSSLQGNVSNLMQQKERTKRSGGTMSYSEIFSPPGILFSSECPLPSLADVNNPMMGRMQHPLLCHTTAQLSCLRPSGGKQTEKGESDIKLTGCPGSSDTNKSGLVMSENTSCPHSSDRKKIPFKRLMKPILKHKSSNPQHPIEGNVNSLGRCPTGVGSAHDKKHAESPMQGLLQFTIMNGFPLFKLLVDTNRNVLVATAKDLTPCGKNGAAGQSCYTFYLVNEIKSKTSGWKRPGNRDRSYGYACNVIGQMQMNSDYEYSNGKCITESILFGVEMRPEDPESAIIMKNRELAAIVLKVPTENSKHDGQQSCNVLIENGMKFLSEDNGVVILPGDVHGSPSSGQPSTLINRWSSGGVCDCGGWDIGCKLRVLSIPNKLITSKACPVSKCLQLFVQGDEQDKPIFSMTPLKGGFFEISPSCPGGRSRHHLLVPKEFAFSGASNNTWPPGRHDGFKSSLIPKLRIKKISNFAMLTFRVWV